MNFKLNSLVITISTTALLVSCGSEQKKEESSGISAEETRYDESLKDKLSPFVALPASAENPDNKSSAEKIALGHKLYFDNQLSKDNHISCNSCHNLASYGVDLLPTSPGDAGKNGDRNSPTVLNAALHETQFWDGRAKDVEEQAGGPIINPVEMAIPDKAYLVARLSKIPEYQEWFKKAFPNDANPISYDNIQKAIATFERELLTPSRFDQYLNGDKKALSLQEKRGLSTFINVGCTTCHNGVAIGGSSFQKFGVYGNYWDYTKSSKIDDGRYNVTKLEANKYQFKVPSLRNIEKTAPYFHDGSINDLGKAVEIMAKAQLNYDLNEEEKNNLVAFLKSLTGSVPAEYQKAP